MKKGEIMNGNRLIKTNKKHKSNFSNYSLYIKDPQDYSYIEMNDQGNVDMEISTNNELNENQIKNLILIIVLKVIKRKNVYQIL